MVDPRHRRTRWARAGGDHGLLERDGLAALDGQLVRAGEAAAARHDLHAVGLQQPAEALDDTVDDGAAVRLDLVEVELQPRGLDPERRHVTARLVPGVCGLHHRFCGDAADVQAGPANGALLHADDRSAELGGADRGGIAAWPRAEYEDVAFHGSGFPRVEVLRGIIGRPRALRSAP
jgi:hypothetical protein